MLRLDRVWPYCRCCQSGHRSPSHLTSSLYSSRFASSFTLHGPSQNSCFHSPRQRAPPPSLHLTSRLNSPRLDSSFTSHGPSQNSSFHSPRQHCPLPLLSFHSSPSSGPMMPTTIKTTLRGRALMSLPLLPLRFFPLADESS